MALKFSCSCVRFPPAFPEWSSTTLASSRRHDRFLDETDEDAGVKRTKTFQLKSGDELLVTLGRERFHAPEILFTVR